MKRATLLLTMWALVACDRPAPMADKVPSADKSGAFPDKPPVIDAAPVDAKSYDAGFQLGYTAGNATARPRDVVPEDAAAQRLADEVAGRDPTRNKKWREGWANGYLEGFRARAQHTK